MDLLFRDDQTLMREALRLAKKAGASDEVPIGAVIAKNGHIVGRGYNQVEMLKDPTASTRRRRPPPGCCATPPIRGARRPAGSDAAGSPTVGTAGAGTVHRALKIFR